MITVIIPAVLRELCGGTAKLVIAATTVDGLLRAVEERCPGFYDRVVEHGHVRPELMFALDGYGAQVALPPPLRRGVYFSFARPLGGV